MFIENHKNIEDNSEKQTSKLQLIIQPQFDRTNTTYVNEKRLLFLPKSNYTSKQIRAHHPHFDRSHFHFRESNLLAFVHNPFHHNISTISIEFSFLFWEDRDTKLAQKLLQPVRRLDKLVVESAPWNTWGLSFLTKRYQFRLKHLQIQIQSDFGYFSKLTKKLSYFRGLESLRLCLESFNLPNPEGYCKHFQSLSNLKTLWLESTRRTGILINFATEVTKYLPKLECLILCVSKLEQPRREETKGSKSTAQEDDSIHRLSLVIGKLSKLQQLGLSFNESNCKKSDITSLMKAVSNLNLLEKLSLSFAKLEITDAQHSSISENLVLPEGIQELKLNFSFWKENEKIEKNNFFQNYFKLKQLKALELNPAGSRQFSSAFLDDFFEFKKMSSCDCLVRLSLTLFLNKSDSDKFSSFCRILGHFGSLQKLYLNFEPIEQLFVEKTSSLALALRDLVYLNNLELEFSTFNDDNVENLIEIANAIGCLDDLDTLRLRFQFMSLTTHSSQKLLLALGKAFSKLSLLENISFQCDSSLTFSSKAISELINGLQKKIGLKTVKLIFGKCQLEVEDFEQILKVTNCWSHLANIHFSFDSEFLDEKTIIGIPERLLENRFLESISIEIRNSKIDYEAANQIITEAKKFLYFVPHLVFSFAALSRANARDSRTKKVLQHLNNQKGRQIPESWKIYI